jgi:hypothetical protein
MAIRRDHLSDAEVDRLFTRLLVRYGAPFSDRWRTLDLAVVKADWARELGRFSRQPEALAWALEHLPERPPTVIDFARLCEQAPRHEAMASSTARTRGPNDFERESIRQLREVLPVPGKATRRSAGLEARADRSWAQRLLERHERGYRHATPAALAMARDALGQVVSASGQWADDEQVRVMREQELAQLDQGGERAAPTHADVQAEPQACTGADDSKELPWL